MRENNNEMGKRVCDCLHLNFKILSRENGDEQGDCDARARVQVSNGFGGLSRASCTSAGFTDGCLAVSR